VKHIIVACTVGSTRENAADDDLAPSDKQED